MDTHKILMNDDGDRPDLSISPGFVSLRDFNAISKDCLFAKMVPYLVVRKLKLKRWSTLGL